MGPGVADLVPALRPGAGVVRRGQGAGRDAGAGRRVAEGAGRAHGSRAAHPAPPDQGAGPGHLGRPRPLPVAREPAVTGARHR